MSGFLAVTALLLQLTGRADASDLGNGNVVVANGNHTVAAVLTLINNAVIPLTHVFPTVDGGTITARELQELYTEGRLITLNEPLIGGKIDEIIENFDPSQVNIDLRPGTFGRPFSELPVIQEPMVLGANARPAVLTTVGNRVNTLIQVGNCVLDRFGRCVNVVEVVSDPVTATTDWCVEGALTGNPFCLIGGGLVTVALAPHVANAGVDVLVDDALTREPLWVEANEVLNQPPTHSVTYPVVAGEEIEHLHSIYPNYTEEEIRFMEQHIEFAEIMARLLAEGHL